MWFSKETEEQKLQTTVSLKTAGRIRFSQANENCLNFNYKYVLKTTAKSVYKQYFFLVVSGNSKAHHICLSRKPTSLTGNSRRYFNKLPKFNKNTASSKLKLWAFEDVYPPYVANKERRHNKSLFFQQCPSHKDSQF